MFAKQWIVEIDGYTRQICFRWALSSHIGKIDKITKTNRRKAKTTTFA